MRVCTFFLKWLVGVISVLLFWVPAGVAGFPEKPIQVLVGWPVGSTMDIMDRAIAPRLSNILKQPVIVQNVPGGGGALVLGRVKIEKPDGYTIFQTGMGMYSQLPWVRQLPFDPLKDFAYLAQHSKFMHYVLVRSDSPWKTLEDLIQHAMKNPKTIKYATSGVGNTIHIAMEYLAVKKNLKLVHVPYNASTEVATALLGGHIDVAAVTVGLELEQIKAGRFRPLVCLNDKRIELLPDLPTIGEVVKDYDFNCISTCIWSAPAGTPKDIQATLERALLQSFKDPEVGAILKRLNSPYDPLDAAATTKVLFADYERYGKAMKQLGLGIYKK